MITLQIASSDTGRVSPCFSFPTLVLHIHPRQDDVVQHSHPLRLNVQFRLLSPCEVVRTVVFSDYCFLPIGGDQLYTVVQPR